MSDVLTDLEAQIVTILNVTADSGLELATVGPDDRMLLDMPFAQIVFSDAQILSDWDANAQLMYERDITLEITAKESADINLVLQKCAYIFHKQPYRAQLAALNCGDIQSYTDSTSYEVDEENNVLYGTLTFTMKYFSPIT